MIVQSDRLIKLLTKFMYQAGKICGSESQFGLALLLTGCQSGGSFLEPVASKMKRSNMRIKQIESENRSIR